MTHNTITVYAFLKTLINDHIKARYPFLKSKSYFSDGSPAQYKNYKNFTNLLMHKKDFGMNAEWHFFATSHGKNVCDGAGETLKRLTAHAGFVAAIESKVSQLLLSSIILKIFSKHLTPREQQKLVLTCFNLENILSNLALETETVSHNLMINSMLL